MISSKPYSFQSILRGNPYFEQILGSGPPLGSKLCWAPLTKILDPRLPGVPSVVGTGTESQSIPQSYKIQFFNFRQGQRCQSNTIAGPILTLTGVGHFGSRPHLWAQEPAFQMTPRNKTKAWFWQKSFFEAKDFSCSWAPRDVTIGASLLLDQSRISRTLEPILFWFVWEKVDAH